MRFGWEGVLSHTWISPWHSEKGLLCEKDHQKEICHICTYEWRNQCISGYMFDYQKEICHICTYEWRNQCISEYMFDCWISTFLHSED